MSVAMGLVPSSVVATVTWHVVGLHGGKQEACALAGSSSGLSESSGCVKAWSVGKKTKKHVHTIDCIKKRAHKGHCWILGNGLTGEEKEPYILSSTYRYI